MFTYSRAINTVFGSGAIAQTGRVMKDLGCHKAIVCCCEGFAEFGILQKLLDVLDADGLEHVLYDRIVPDPRKSGVDEVCALVNKEKTDCFIAVGGGSAIDTAKVANSLMANPQYDITNMPAQINPGQPVIAIPTTAGTGSDQSAGGVISDDKTHQKIGVSTAVPTWSICDPELTLTLPMGTTVAGGVDAFAHALESYTSTWASKYTDVFCEKCISIVSNSLPALAENSKDIAAREDMMFASSSMGAVISVAPPHIGHACGHVIGGTLSITHGIAVAVILPGLMKLIAPAVEGKMRTIAKLMDISLPDDTTGLQLGEIMEHRLGERLHSWGVKNLQEQGFSMEQLEQCIPAIMSDGTIYLSPVVPTADDIRAILKTAWSF